MLRKKIRLKLSLGLNSPSVLDTPVSVGELIKSSDIAILISLFIWFFNV